MRILLLASLFAVVASACGSESVVRTRTVAEPPPCRPGRGAPITERALKIAFAAEGIRMYRDKDCFDSELVLLSNITDAVPREREDATVTSEGHIWCQVYAGGTSARIFRYVWRNDPRPTFVEALNVSCSIYPETIRQTDTVERILRRLPGVHRLPSAVPSPDAVHD